MKFTKEDKEWANSVKERDDFTCQICGKKSNKVNAHHIFPRMFKEIRHNINNGITLCFICHKVGRYSAHQNAIAFSKWINENKKGQLDRLGGDTKWLVG